MTPQELEDSYRFIPPQRNWLQKHLRGAINLTGGLVFTLATAGYARFIAPFKTQYIEIPAPLRNLPSSFENFRLLQVTDLHTNGWMPIKHLRRVIQRVNDMPHDIVIVTGDLVSHSLKWIDQTCDLLAELKKPVVATLGNHDYSPSVEPWSSHEVADALTQSLQSRGIEVLRNRALPIEHADGRIWLVGLEDFWSGFFSPEKAFANVNQNDPIIALSHNPDSVFSLRRFGAQWVIAGHTHGGQIRLPLLGSMMLPVYFKQFDQGLFDVRGTKMYVSRGVGCRVPVRFRCPPEVTTFILTQA